MFRFILLIWLGLSFSAYSQTSPHNPPVRIATLSPQITQFALDLNLDDKIKGVSAYSDTDKLAADLPIVSDYYHVNIEQLIHLNIDLILAEPHQKKHLTKSPIKIIYLEFNQISDLLQNYKLLKPVFALNPQQDDHFLSRYQNVLTSIENFKTNDPFQFLYLVGLAPNYAMGGGGWINQLLEKCGGVNILEAYEGYPLIPEELLYQDNLIIFIDNELEPSLKKRNLTSRIVALNNQYSYQLALKSILYYQSLCEKLAI